MNKFIPIYQYAKKRGISRQNIYRWIREGKIPKEKIKIVEKIVKRIEIDENFNGLIYNP